MGLTLLSLRVLSLSLTMVCRRGDREVEEAEMEMEWWD